MADRRSLPGFALPTGLVVGAAVAGQLASLQGTGASIPLEVMARALIYGLTSSLLVIGLVLIYRAAKIINFAHTAIGFSASFLYLLLRTVWGWGFWVTVPAVVASSAVLGLLIEVSIIRRFARAPRLVLTVVTIALGTTLVGGALTMPQVFGLDTDDPLPPIPPSQPLGSVEVQWGVVVFGFAEFAALAVGIGLLVGLAVFLRVSTTGIAIRGAAENRSRAALLGVNVNTLSSLVWIIAAVMAAAGSLLDLLLNESALAAVAGSGAGAAFSGGVFVRALAAAVIGRMTNLPVAVSAAVSIALLDQSIFWSYRQTAVVDGVLVLVIVVALLVQRRSFSRADAGATDTWEAAKELQPIPSALAHLSPVRRTRTRFLAGVAVALAAFPWAMSPTQTLQGSLFAIYAIVAVSLVVLTGWGGQISLGQFGFVAVGALVGGWATAGAGLPFPVAVVLAMVAGAVAAIAVGLPALRIQGLFLAITSLGFAVATQSILLNDRWFDGVIQPRVTRPVFFGIDMNTSGGERAFFYLCCAAAALAIFIAVSLRATRTGRVLIALRDNDSAAQSYGINLLRTRLTTFAIAGALAGLAGILFANHQYSVTQSSFGPDQSIFLFLMSVMGGLGSVYGVLLGVLYFGLTRVVLADVGGQLLASSFGVLLVLVAFPEGLGGIAYRVRDAWLRRIALRYRIFVPSLQGVDRNLDPNAVALIPIASRPDDRDEVPRTYVLDSLVATAGSSQHVERMR